MMAREKQLSNVSKELGCTALVSAHLDGHQHGVSIQISTNLSKTFLRISCIRKIAVTESWRESLHICLLCFLRFWVLSVEGF